MRLDVPDHAGGEKALLLSVAVSQCGRIISRKSDGTFMVDRWIQPFRFTVSTS